MLEAKVRAGVATAFRQVKDLAKPSVFHKRTNSDFDFDNPDGTVTEQDVPCKVVQIDLKRDYMNRRNQTATFLFDSSELGDIRGYDRLTYDGRVWELDAITEGNDFIIMIVGYSEAQV